MSLKPYLLTVKNGGFMRKLILFILVLGFFNLLMAGDPGVKGLSMPQGDDQPSGGFHFNMGVSAGAAVLDGQLYNQIGIRPLFTIGKLGIALDLSVYLDADGNIRKENWDNARDIFEKFYFIRWARPGAPLYIKVGAIDNYRLGFGLLMNHYANTVEYPNVIRTGLELGINGKQLGFQAMLNNFSELFDGGGVMAGRMRYNLLGDLELGVSAVYDRNQFKGLKDRDGDGVPDFVDDFPNDKSNQIDSDGDGIPDSVDPDRDGNGYTDNSQNPAIANNDPDIATIDQRLKHAPFNINSATGKEQFAFAADISYPFVKQKYLQLTAYSQYAKFGNNGGWGATVPGVRAKFWIMDAFAEYRIFSDKFIPEYFNTTYELERAVFRGDSVVTKQQVLQMVNEKLQGYVIGADFKIGTFLVFGAEYQDMSKNSFEFKTFRVNLDLNSTLIPKVNKAGAYFFQNNTSLSDLFDRTEGTILGYRLGYDIGGGASLVLDYRQTYRDKNGDGVISGSNEIVKTTQIQTVFMF